MIHCPTDGIVPVPEKDLPVVLPDNVSITLAGGSPLASVPEFVNVTCPKCGGPARRETDTMDTFVDSSWYFYRYTSAGDDQAPFDRDAVAYWFPIDQYIGGAEHAILHLIYSRFWTKFMRDLGLVKNSEPTERLFTQGMVIKNGFKMSKNRGNVVSPDDMVAKYGADSTRMYALFAAPPHRDLDWQDSGLEGVSRFLSRVYRFVARNAPLSAANRCRHPERSDRGSAGEGLRCSGGNGNLSSAARKIQRKLQTIVASPKTSADAGTAPSPPSWAQIPLYAYEDAVSRGEQPAPSSLFADVRDLRSHAGSRALCCGRAVGDAAETTDLLRAPWPKYDPALAKEEEIEMAVQVNGKIKARITVPPDAEETQIRETALSDEKVKAAIAGKEIVKVLVVKGRLVNIVVK
jgi:leucyl-tRNA synthetase